MLRLCVRIDVLKFTLFLFNGSPCSHINGRLKELVKEKEKAKRDWRMLILQLDCPEYNCFHNIFAPIARHKNWSNGKYTYTLNIKHLIEFNNFKRMIKLTILHFSTFIFQFNSIGYIYLHQTCEIVKSSLSENETI